MEFLIRLVLFIMFVGISGIVFVDESGIEDRYQRERGRAPRGARVEDTRRGRKTKRTNIIAGLVNGEHVAVQSYGHSTTGAFFEDWFEFELLGAIPQKSLVIMDNASFHRKKQINSIAARHGVFVLFLPTYSPDLNLIEPSWANFKFWLCDNLAKYPSLDFAIMAYFGS